MLAMGSFVAYLFIISTLLLNGGDGIGINILYTVLPGGFMPMQSSELFTFAINSQDEPSRELWQVFLQTGALEIGIFYGLAYRGVKKRLT